MYLYMYNNHCDLCINVSYSTLDSSDRDRVTVTSIVDKGSPFISCQADINV